MMAKSSRIGRKHWLVCTRVLLAACALLGMLAGHVLAQGTLVEDSSSDAAPPIDGDTSALASAAIYAASGVFAAPTSGFMGWGYSSSHPALDIWTSMSSNPLPGNEVRAAYDGTVYAIYRADHHDSWSTDGSWPRSVVVLRHTGVPGAPSPLYTLYLHMANNDTRESYVNPSLQAGNRVYGGVTVLGRQGNWKYRDDNDPITHLHFEVAAQCCMANRTRLNPFDLLGFTLSWGQAFPPASGGCPDIREWKGEYWNNPRLEGNPILCRNDGQVSFDWGNGSPGGSVPSDRFSARWTRNLSFTAGRYLFHLSGDDGIRLTLDGNRVIDAWRDQGRTEYQANVSLGDGSHRLQVEYYENGGDANVTLWWERLNDVVCNGQYLAQYFNGQGLGGSPAFATCEGWPVNHNWGGGGPGNGVGSDNFSARWSGRAYIDAGTYTFIARADDGVRVSIDGAWIINAWRDQGATEYRETRSISAGYHDIRVEYYENGGDAVAQFRWERAAQPNNDYYKIIAKHSGKCLDVASGSRDSGATVVQWDYLGSDNQLWSLVPVGAYYKIVAKHSGKCLDVTGGSRDAGAALIQWDCHGGDNQLFSIVGQSGYYKVIAKHSGKCLDIYGGSRDNGAALIQWDCHGGDNQLWTIARP